MLPSIKEVPYAPLRKIEFFGKAGSLRALRSHTLRSPISTAPLASSYSAVPSPSSEEVGDFFTPLSRCSTKPAVFALVESHSSSSFDDLLRLSEETEIVVTVHQSRTVEEETRSQANSRLWFHMRAGRITASKLKALCSTDPAMPPVSLIFVHLSPRAIKI